MAERQDRSEMTGCTDSRKEVCSDICEDLLPSPLPQRTALYSPPLI